MAVGRRIADPEGVEGRSGAADGLGLLDVETELTGNKTLRQAAGRDQTAHRQSPRIRPGN